MAYYDCIVTLPNNEVVCTLCDTAVQDNSKLLEAHLHDRKHRELYMKTLMTTNNIIIGTSDLFCYICDCRIDISNLIDHVQSNLHQAKYSEIKEMVTSDGGLIVLPEKTSSNSSAYCITCDKDVEFIHESIKCHLDSMEHKRRRAMVLQPLNAIFSVEGNDQYLWCKLCNIFFNNYIELIFHHIEKTDHAKKMAKILRLINGQSIDIETYLQDCKQHVAYCNKCDIEVPCNVDNLQSHINGKKHKSAM